LDTKPLFYVIKRGFLALYYSDSFKPPHGLSIFQSSKNAKKVKANKIIEQFLIIIQFLSLCAANFYCGRFYKAGKFVELGFGD
jgi:hypothetical protein